MNIQTKIPTTPAEQMGQFLSGLTTMNFGKSIAVMAVESIGERVKGRPLCHTNIDYIRQTIIDAGIGIANAPTGTGSLGAFDKWLSSNGFKSQGEEIGQYNTLAQWSISTFDLKLGDIIVSQVGHGVGALATIFTGEDNQGTQMGVQANGLVRGVQLVGRDYLSVRVYRYVGAA